VTAHAPEQLDRERVEEGELSAGGTRSRPFGRDGARHLGEELVLAMPTVIGRPTAQTLARRRIVSRCEPASRPSPNVEERLVDREPFDEWGRVMNSSNTALLASEYADIRGGTTIA
jgi:hypothetical protein